MPLQKGWHIPVICVGVLLALSAAGTLVYGGALTRQYEENGRVHERLLEELAALSQEQVVLNEASRQLELVKAEYEVLETSFRQRKDSAVRTEEYAQRCQERQEELIREQEEIVSQTKLCLMEGYMRVYDLTVGQKTQFAAEEKDYLVSAISEITGNDSIGESARDLMDGIQSGASAWTVIENILQNVAEGAKDAVLSKIVSTICPEELLSAATLGADIFGENNQAMTLMIQKVTENISFYLYDINALMSKEVLSTKDYETCLADFGALDTILRTVEQLAGQDFGYPDFGDICETLRQYQTQKAQTHWLIELYGKEIERAHENS